MHGDHLGDGCSKEQSIDESSARTSKLMVCIPVASDRSICDKCLSGPVARARVR
jgi:hypothetical protein